MAKLTQADLTDLNNTFEERTPEELIHWATEMFGNRVAALSSMQRSGNAICHMLSKMGANIPVLFVDTGVLFQESLDTRDKVRDMYGLRVITLTPEKTMQEQTEEHGVLYLTAEGQQQCCDLRKAQPLLKVSDQYDAFISSLRRVDGGKRANLPILSLDPQTNTIRINPLVGFSKEQFEEYVAENNVYINPLHAQGYATIGCNRCTTPVLESEPGRAGRWRHLGPWSQYCGINPSDMLPPDKLSIDLPLDLIDRILGRETDFVI
ncbi:phosphoadenylyl-sulfate reductase [Calycomorphotria hydatis]|uniref:Adenosine 5'-phosphosulfate reductase n=1 Tax=Calycomorphotria hydatis TaxID=2528027 RepID=A0A517T470_9PLAN|nr:phosphoadenylyl-sulfate reductase [Calycomorphotria hydatis]QDT63160.1 Phosphoadenosine phosphosulfate reductase [Calycomorphotria hydatis]